MKKIHLFYFGTLLFIATGCNESASKKVDQQKAAKSSTEAPVSTAAMTFNKTVHDFGTIKEGETVQTTYKNRGEVGNMSSTMWAQAGMLSEQEIETLGKFVEETMK